MHIARCNLIFFVRDQVAAAAFYRRVLDVEPTLDVPGMTEFSIGPGVVLGLMPERGIRRLLGDAAFSAPGATAPRAELYLLVDDPGAAHARALAAGARERSPLQARDWGECAAYSEDLDGHLVAFAAPLPKG